ncbi:MAG: PP2C family protein-serine/threonine phosphatase [Acidimicrobiales bacterium]
MAPERPAPDAPPSAGVHAVIRAILESTYGLFPDDLTAMIFDRIRRHVTADELILLLVDLDQVELRELSPAGHEPRTFPVDGEGPGRAFRHEAPVHDQRHEGPGRRLWLPVLDSAERLGVLGVVDDGSTSIRDWLTLTSLIGEVLVSKETYGDVVASTRRRHPVSIGAEMRWSTLPPLTFSSPQVCVSGLLQPSHIVAGDAFDYAVSSQRATVGLFDAMGHDLLAARLANLTVGGFRNGRRGGLTPAETFERTDAIVAEQFGKARFTTALVVTLDLDDGTATVITAGHPPPLLVRNDGVATVVPVKPGRPLGLGPSTFEPTTVQLEPGEALLLLSDGVYEGRSPSGEMFGLERTMALAGELFLEEEHPAEVLRRLARTTLDFQQGDVRDDATVALVRWRPEAVGQLTSPTDADLELITA